MEKDKEVKQYLLYSKVDTRSTVACVIKFNLKEVTEEIVKADRIIVMYVVRANGQMAWKYGRQWGFRIDSELARWAGWGYGEEGRSKSYEFNELRWDLSKWLNGMFKHYCFDWVAESSRSWTWVRGGHVGEVLQALWGKMNYPGMNLDEIQSMNIIWGLRKKPELKSFNMEDMVNTAIGQMRRKSDRKLAAHIIQAAVDHEVENDGFSVLNDSVNMATFVERVLSSVELARNPKTRQVLKEHATEREISLINWGAVEKLFNAFPHCSAEMRAVNHNRGSEVNYATDTMRMYKAMNAQEKAMVSGSTFTKVHDSASNVYNRFTGPRLDAKRNAKYANFEYPDWVKDLEDSGLVKLAAPTELSEVGRRMRICVGSYVEQVYRGMIAIFVNDGGADFCLEVSLHKKLKKAKLVQAKMYCNRVVATDQLVHGSLENWCKSKGIEICTYDMSKAAENDRRLVPIIPPVEGGPEIFANGDVEDGDQIPF